MEKLLFIDKDREGQVRQEAKRVRDKYSPKSLEDLRDIAREEYGIKIVEGVGRSRGSAGWNGKSFEIKFNPSNSKPLDSMVLAHEIGHIAMGHPVVRPSSTLTELEAHCFSQELNGITPVRYWIYFLFKEGGEIVKKLASDLYHRIF